METYYRVDLRDKQQNIIYPNIHNLISITDDDGYITIPGLTVKENSTLNGNINLNGITQVNNAIVFNNNIKLYGETQTSILAKVKNTETYHEAIRFADGAQYGLNTIIGAGGNTILGAGESAGNFFNVLEKKDGEQLYLISDTGIDFYVNCQDIAQRKYAWSITPDTTLLGAGAIVIEKHMVLNSKGKYQIAMGAGDTYAWINCRNSNGTVVNNIVLYPTYTRLNATQINGTLTMINANIEFAQSGTITRGIAGAVGDNDGWRVRGGATSSNAGFLEICTTDDGNEPIYVRQYQASNIVRTLTLLDGSGNTDIPGSLTIKNSTYIASGIIRLGSGGGRQVFTSGCGISLGQDQAGSNDANLRFHSWWGIGFAPSVSGQRIPRGENAVYIDCRSGNLTARGTMFTKGNGTVFGANNLYNNDSGTTGTVTLSSSAANYSYLEIFYGKDTGSIHSVRVYNPQGKSASLIMGYYANNGTSSFQQIQTKIVKISGTSITTNSNSTGLSNISYGNSVYIYNSNDIKIYKVLGYKA